MKFINSLLLDPGQPFVITDFAKDTNYGVGSKGFITTIQGGHETYQNVAKIHAVMTRKGKGGKPRIERCEFSIPIFVYFENEENFRKIMPTVAEVRNYQSIEPEEEPGSVSDILQMSTVDFLGWASAIITNLHHVSSKARYGTWPEDQANPLNRFRRMADIYADDSARLVEFYTESKNRKNVIDLIRRTEAALFKIRMSHRVKILDYILNAAEFLVYVNKGEFIPSEQEDKTNEFKFTEDQALLDSNLKYHKEVHESALKLCVEKKIPV